MASVLGSFSVQTCTRQKQQVPAVKKNRSIDDTIREIWANHTKFIDPEVLLTCLCCLQAAVWWSPAEMQRGCRKWPKRWDRRSQHPALPVSLLWLVTSAMRMRRVLVQPLDLLLQNIWVYIFIWFYLHCFVHVAGEKSCLIGAQTVWSYWLPGEQWRRSVQQPSRAHDLQRLEGCDRHKPDGNFPLLQRR